MIDIKLRKDKKFHWLINIGLRDHAIIHGGGGFTMAYDQHCLDNKSVFIESEIEGFTYLVHHRVKGFYVYL